MIKYNREELASMHINGYNISAVYMRGRLIWPIKKDPEDSEVLSCFYNGYWIDEYPWTDDTPWTDNINA